jgi:soluble lytic murein transglycosylase-like protein
MKTTSFLVTITTALIMSSVLPTDTSLITKAPDFISKPYLMDWISVMAPKYGLDPNLVDAVVEAESNFDPFKVSKSGAIGLMQLKKSTFDDIFKGNIYDPMDNLKAGMLYLEKLLKRFDNNYELAIAAYNSGPAAVEKYKGIPPYKETQNYVKIVMNYYKKFSNGGS